MTAPHRSVLGIAALALAPAALCLGASPALAQEAAAPAPATADHGPQFPTNSAGLYGLEHTHIITENLERSIKFYTELLGFTVERPIRDIGADKWMQVMLGVPGATFRVAHIRMPGKPSYGDHVPTIEIWEIHGVPLQTGLAANPAVNLRGKGYNSYRVYGLDAILARLKAAGVRFISAPVRPSPIRAGIYVVDPDDQIVELDEYE